MNDTEKIKSTRSKHINYKIDFEKQIVAIIDTSKENEVIRNVPLYDVINIAQLYFKRRKLENALTDYEIELSQLSTEKKENV